VITLQQAIGSIPAGIKLLETIVEDEASALEGLAYKELFAGLARFSFPLLELLPPTWVGAPRNLLIDLGESSSWPGVLDQGTLGSCVDNSVSTCLSVVETKEQGVSAGNFQASRLFLYGNAREWTSEDSGSTLGASAKGARIWGVPPESAWPYDIALFATRPPPPVWTQAAQRKLTQSYWTLSLVSIIHSLQAGYPVSFCTVLYESFGDMNDAQGWIMPKPKPGEKVVGGHCMTVRGIDLKRKLALVQNSWGASWGAGSQGIVHADGSPGPALKGCFWMPLDILCSPTLCNSWRTFRKVANT
jgi:hypothetical protein